MTEVNGHSRHVLSGIHLGLFRMDPCFQPAGMTPGVFSH
jgi:hypothetical protein